MEERRAAMFPNCRCRPEIAALRVLVDVPEEDPKVAGEAEVGVDDVMGKDAANVVAPVVGCGGGCGGWLLDCAAEFAMGSDKASDTKLLGLMDRQREYEW
jgi:hypothetical protein